MFDGFKNMAGLAGMMKNLPRMKEKMEEVKSDLAGEQVTAETGGGAVSATVTCAMQVVSIDIEPAMMTGLLEGDTPEDRELAQDLIVGAVNAALEKARGRAEERLTEAASELGLPMPGGGLGGLMQ